MSDLGVGTPKRRYNVVADWDDEAKVWVATSPDIPGLVTEARTLEELLNKLYVMVPEMLVENGLVQSDDGFPEVPFTVITQHVARRAVSD